MPKHTHASHWRACVLALDRTTSLPVVCPRRDGLSHSRRLTNSAVKFLAPRITHMRLLDYRTDVFPLHQASGRRVQPLNHNFRLPQYQPPCGNVLLQWIDCVHVVNIIGVVYIRHHSQYRNTLHV